jgi:septal ring factor EnvC (AmiA/AmiB activator)
VRMLRKVTIYIAIAVVSTLATSIASEDSLVIDRLRKQLDKDRSRLDSLSNIKRTEVEQLNSLDQQLELTSELINRLDSEIGRLNRRSRRLADEQTNLDSALAVAKARLAVSVRSFYIRKRRPARMILASSELGDAFARMLYTRRTVESLKDMVERSDSLSDMIDANIAELATTRASLQNAGKEKRMEEEFLRSEYKKRDELMEGIRRDEIQFREHVRQLTDDIASSDSLFSVESPDVEGSLFEEQKGRLPFPVDGKIVRSFGLHKDKVTGTDVFFPGIEISAREGEEVHAVYDGTIFHRGFLRGYGRVIILDHGDGWYSLYGYLSEYFGRIGDAVLSGDPIGTSGTNSKGESCLHFQIRHRREQLDPVEWLRR